MIEIVEAALQEGRTALADLLNNKATLQKVVEASRKMTEVFEKRGHVFSCGNGGSMCDANHFAEELSGRFRGDRPALGAISMGDAAFLSCAANDFGLVLLLCSSMRAWRSPVAPV